MIKPNARWFCMACGADFVAPLRYGEGSEYGMAPPPDVPTPGFCDAERCSAARERFEATAARILANVRRGHACKPGPAWEGGSTCERCGGWKSTLSPCDPHEACPADAPSAEVQR